MTQLTTHIGRTARRLAMLAVPLLVAATGTAAAHGGGSYGGGMMGYAGTGGWWWLVGMLVPLIFLLLLSGGYFIFQRASETQTSQDPAMKELRTAYARGDLTNEEFEARCKRLEQSG